MLLLMYIYIPESTFVPSLIKHMCKNGEKQTSAEIKLPDHYNHPEYVFTVSLTTYLSYYQVRKWIICSLVYRYGSFNSRYGFKNKNAQMELMSWFRRIELRGSRKLLSRLAQKRRKMMTIQITTR